jgi:hypothetical protein
MHRRDAKGAEYFVKILCIPGGFVRKHVQFRAQQRGWTQMLSHADDLIFPAVPVAVMAEHDLAALAG